MALLGAPGMPGMGGPGMDPMGGAPPMDGGPDQSAWVSGLLAGAGLRELSQVLGLSRRRQEKAPGGAMPPASVMAQGQMGDIDRVMMLARLQQAMGGGPSPLAGPLGGSPAGAGPMPMPGAPGPGGQMGPMGPPPMPTPGIPGPIPMGPGPAPMPAPAPAPSPGGPLPMALLQTLLRGAGGIV